MLLPKDWLRQKRLQRALRDYPIYDPPHKAEDRVLPSEMALENFQYFMDVRRERVRHFNGWLASQFHVRACLEPDGVEEILKWAAKYVGILLPLDIRQNSKIYLAYEAPWTGDYAGANVLFDLAATLGEAVILRRPNLTWQMEWSLSDYPDIERIASRETLLLLRCRQRDIRQSKREKHSGFRRPVLASVDDALDFEDVFAYVQTYYFLVSQSVTVAYARRNIARPKGLLAGNSEYLKDWFRKALQVEKQ